MSASMLRSCPVAFSSRPIMSLSAARAAVEVRVSEGSRSIIADLQIVLTISPPSSDRPPRLPSFSCGDHHVRPAIACAVAMRGYASDGYGSICGRAACRTDCCVDDCSDDARGLQPDRRASVACASNAIRPSPVRDESASSINYTAGIARLRASGRRALRAWWWITCGRSQHHPALLAVRRPEVLITRRFVIAVRLSIDLIAIVDVDVRLRMKACATL